MSILAYKSVGIGYHPLYRSLAPNALCSVFNGMDVYAQHLLPFYKNHTPNCYHSICPYVLVSGVVDKSTSTFPLNGREVQLLSVKVVAHLSDVTASSP